MSRGWSYAVAPGSRHGTMICSVCSVKITDGRYRYRQKSRDGDWSYQSQHDSCSANDPAWAEADKRSAEHQAQRKALSRACREFRDKWDVDELDDYIFEGDDHACVEANRVVVDEAMVSRALNADFHGHRMDDALNSGTDYAHEVMRAALTAALGKEA